MTKNKYPHSHTSHEPSRQPRGTTRAIAIGAVLVSAGLAVRVADQVAQHQETGEPIEVTDNPLTWVTSGPARVVDGLYDAIHPDAIPEDATHIVIKQDSAPAQELQVEVRHDDN